MDGDSPIDSMDSTDSEYADLLDQYLRIQRGYHTLIDECIETAPLRRETLPLGAQLATPRGAPLGGLGPPRLAPSNPKTSRRCWWSVAEHEARSRQRLVADAEHQGGRTQGIIKNIRIQLQNEMDRRMEAEDRSRHLERLMDKFRGIVENGMITDEERQYFFRSVDELDRGDVGNSRVWTGIRKSEDIDAGRISFDRSDDELLDEEEEMRFNTKTGEMNKVTRFFEQGNGNVEIVAETRVHIPDNGDPIQARASLSTHPRRSAPPERRSQSAPRTSDDKNPQPAHRSNGQLVADGMLFIPNRVLRRSGTVVDAAGDAPGPSGMEPGSDRRRSRSMGGGLDIQHNFTSKRMWADTKCGQCGRMVKFGTSGVFCNDCRLLVHGHCRVFVTAACLSDQQRPNADHSSGQWIDLNKVAPQRSPRIPAVFVLLVRHIEARMEEGLYRIPGSVEQVKKLKRDLLKNNFVIRMDDVDVHVACSLLKNVLTGLKEPLLTYALWNQFSDSASSSKMEDFYGLINKLPPANKETLAHLMRHFLKIACHPLVRMPPGNLVKTIAPSLVGYSVPDEQLTPSMITAESFHQQLIMGRLMDIRAQFWDDILEYIPSDSNSAASLPRGHNSPDSDYRQGPSDGFLQNGFRSTGIFSSAARAFFGNGTSKAVSSSRLDPSDFKSPLAD